MALVPRTGDLMHLVITEDDFGVWLQLEGESAAEWQRLDDLAPSRIRTCGPAGTLHACRASSEPGWGQASATTRQGQGVPLLYRRQAR